MRLFLMNTTTTPWLYSPCRTLASYMAIFQLSLLCARILQSVTPILLRSSLTSSIHLNLGLPTLLLPSAVFWYNLFTTISSLILSTCPSHLNLPFVISVTMFNSPYNCLTSSFVLLLQYPATHNGPNIFLSTFLSQIRKFFSSSAVKHHASEPYRTTGLNFLMNTHRKIHWWEVWTLWGMWHW